MDGFVGQAGTVGKSLQRESASYAKDMYTAGNTPERGRFFARHGHLPPYPAVDTLLTIKTSRSS